MPFWKRKPSEPDSPASGPDFSNIDSLEKALALVEEGELEPLHLMPLEFGGPDNPLNTVYVPVGIAYIKRETDLNIIAPLIASGDVEEYSANPEYRGKSFVPKSIEVIASNPKRFRTKIVVWGEALDCQ